MLLSLIIPIYNVEQYIEECLESICNQLKPDMSVEIILVNDGTPDNSMSLAKQFIKNGYINFLNKFIFIDQENQGLSGARNTGLEKSKGKYICFLDSDDKLELTYMESLLSIIKENDVDIIQFHANRFNDSGDEFEFLKIINYSGMYNLSGEIYELIFKQSVWFAWLRCYKKKLFMGLNFPLGRNYEDAYLIPDIFIKAETVFFYNERLLNYRINLNGITYNYSEKNIEDCFFVVEKNLNKIKDNSLYFYSFFNILAYYIDIGYKSKNINNSMKILRYHFYKNIDIKLSLKQKIILNHPVFFVFLKNLKKYGVYKC